MQLDCLATAKRKASALNRRTAILAVWCASLYPPSLLSPFENGLFASSLFLPSPPISWGYHNSSKRDKVKGQEFGGFGSDFNTWEGKHLEGGWTLSLSLFCAEVCCMERVPGAVSWCFGITCFHPSDLTRFCCLTLTQLITVFLECWTHFQGRAWFAQSNSSLVSSALDRRGLITNSSSSLQWLSWNQ